MIGLLLVLVVLGAVLYIVETYVPMPAPFRILVRVIVAVMVIGYLVRLAGLAGPGPSLLAP